MILSFVMPLFILDVISVGAADNNIDDKKKARTMEVGQQRIAKLFAGSSRIRNLSSRGTFQAGGSLL